MGKSRQRDGSPAGVPAESILSTDFSLCHDADDWFDVVMFCTSPALNPAGIILDWHFSTRSWEEEENAIRPLLAGIGAGGIPVVRGIRGQLSRGTDGSITAPGHHDGARLILDTMRRARGKVRLFNAGSLRNEALAYSLEPELFSRKLDRMYILGGELNRPNNECNHQYDKTAFEIVFNAPLPKAWVWADRDNLVQWFTPDHEHAMRAIAHPTARMLSRQLDDFRAARRDIAAMGPGSAVYRTNMFGKSLWSNPLFLHALGHDDDFGLVWERGRCFYDPGLTTCFEPRADGRDILLTARDPGKICDWVLARLQSLAATRGGEPAVSGDGELPDSQTCGETGA